MEKKNSIPLTLYKASPKRPIVVSVPAMKFFMIDGVGDPNTSQTFQEAIQALYGLAYTIKFGRKKRGEASDYKIAPLEGLWWSDDPKAFGAGGDTSKWQWTLMLAAPDFITKRDVQRAAKELQAKKDVPLLAAVRLDKFSEGRAIQIMHVGPYASEGPTIERMNTFAKEHGYPLTGKHHEIYLGDPRRAKPERLKTILRHPIGRNRTYAHA